MSEDIPTFTTDEIFGCDCADRDGTSNPPETRSQRATRIAQCFADKAMNVAERGRTGDAASAAHYAEVALRLGDLAELAQHWEAAEHNRRVMG